MSLTLIRHAHAVDLTPDEARPLSDRGREQVRALAKFLRKPDALVVDEIWHSPLRRAHETAELLAEELKFSGVLRETAGLRPEDDPRAIAKLLMACHRAVAVVGHEPHLSALASLLVTGRAYPAAFAMKKGAALALERADHRCIVRWHVAPAFLG